MPSKELTEPAFHPIARHGIADSLADGQPEARQALPPAIGVHGKVGASQPFPMAVAACVFGRGGEALTFAQALIHSASNGQARPALLAASPQNLASATGRHARSEAMGAAPLYPTRLIGPFHARVPGRPCRVLPRLLAQSARG
jgi:hypothetical protein